MSMESTGALAAAIDIGGTKIAAGIVDPLGGRLLERFALPTPGAHAAVSAEQVVGDVLARLHGCAAWSSVAAVGIASAGPLDLRRETISPLNVPHWRDFGVGAAVRAATGDALPVRLVGDGAAMAFGEQRLGAGAGAAGVVGVVVSTGVGGGLVIDGRVWEGARGNAGLVGHVVIDPDGEPCPCGRRGCVETIASGPAIARCARRDGWRPAAGAAADARAVARSALAGDPVAAQALRSAAAALARGLADVTAVLDAELVVVGGGVGVGAPWIVEEIGRALAADPLGAGVRVRPAALGNDAGLVGAALLALEAAGPNASAGATPIAVPTWRDVRR
jgi:glucokinase